MKKFAKLLSMVLAVAMVLTMFVGAFEYKDNAAIDEDKADAVYALYDYGVMQGNDKGEFNPKGLLARNEMSKIMYALVKGGWTTPASYYGAMLSTFADADSVPKWSTDYLGYAFMRGIFIGNDQNKIDALGNISYVQTAIVLLRALGVEDNWKEIGDGILVNGGDYKVGDVTYSRYAGPKWFDHAVADADELGLFEGLDIENFKANITREDVAVMVNNAIELTDEYFELAVKVGGIVTGTKKIDGVEYLVVEDGQYVEYYPADGVEVAKFMGRQVEFSRNNKELKKQVIVAAIKAVNNTEFDTTVAGVKYDIKDGKATISIDGKKIAEKLTYTEASQIPVYLFFNSTTECTKTNLGDLYEELAYEQEENFWQDAKIIVSKKGVSIFYSPIEFWFKGDDITLIPEIKDKQYTGKYYVELDGEKVYVPALVNELADDTLIAFYLDGSEAKIAGFPKKAALSKFSATMSSGGKYSFTMGGETYLNIGWVPDDAIVAAMINGSYEYAYIFEGKLIGLVGEKLVKSDYVYVKDFSVSVVEGKVAYTVDAILNGELKQITVKGIEDDLADVKGNVYELYTLVKADEAEFDGLKAGDQVLIPVQGGYDVCVTDGADIDQFVTALGYITLEGYTEDISNAVLVGYDAKTDTLFDASKLAVIGASCKLDGKNIVKDALTVITVEKSSSGSYDYDVAYALVIYNIG